MVSARKLLWKSFFNSVQRVEKYRPDTLDDVSGHQDILATINKFVDSNVFLPPFATIQ